MRKAFKSFLVVSLLIAFLSCSTDPYIAGQMQNENDIKEALNSKSISEIEIEAKEYNFDDNLYISRDVKVYAENGSATLNFPEGKGIVVEESVGNGDVALNNLNIVGSLTVNGGGSNSIHLNNTTVSEVIMDKKLDSSDSSVEVPRLVLQGESKVTKLTVNQNAIIDVEKENSVIEKSELKAEVVVVGNDSEVLGEVTKDESVEIKKGVASIGTEYYESFADALANLSDGDTLALHSDVVYSDVSETASATSYKISVPCVIEGNGYSLLNSVAFSSEDKNNRMLDICDVNDGSVVINNLNIVSTTYCPYFRGLNIYNTENVNVILNNVRIDLPHYYALNIPASNKSLGIEMDSCSLRGVVCNKQLCKLPYIESQ